MVCTERGRCGEGHLPRYARAAKVFAPEHKLTAGGHLPTPAQMGHFAE